MGPGMGGSPVKESSYLQRETSAEDVEDEGEQPDEGMGGPEGLTEKEVNEQGSENARSRTVPIQ
jgi:hypothetical protein